MDYVSSSHRFCAFFSRIYPWAPECSENGGSVGLEFVTSCVALPLFILPPPLSRVSGATDCTFSKLIHPCTTTIFFRVQCAVYVKLPFHDPDSSHFGYTQHGHVYVGSTAVSVAKRNFNRQAKFKQLRNGQAVHAELSCSSSGNFNIYNTVVLETHTIYDHAWVREHCLISCWQPALNHQFILKYLKVNSWRMEVPALNPTIPLRSNSAHDYFKGWDDAWPP